MPPYPGRFLSQSESVCLLGCIKRASAPALAGGIHPSWGRAHPVGWRRRDSVRPAGFDLTPRLRVVGQDGCVLSKAWPRILSSVVPTLRSPLAGGFEEADGSMPLTI